MYATLRRYEGIDKDRVDEVTKKFGERLGPRMSKLPGFGGYFLIEAGEGVMTSINLFETSDQAHESTRLAATWIREENLETVLPNTPKITAGEVVVHEMNGATKA